MRIHAVMAGLNGDANVQYVELRMCQAGQPFVQTHTLKFYDGSNVLKATFTFPTMVSNSAQGESILVATSEFNTASTGPGGGGSGGDANFVFSMANTVGANGGDPLHPVQGPNGKVTFGEGSGTGCAASVPIDSLAYGTATADYGTAAAPLPSPSNVCVLRLSTALVGGTPTDNSTQYSLQSASATAKTVAVGSLATDLDTPRNNMRQVATLATADTDCDGVTNPTDNCPSVANPGQENNVHSGTTIGDHCEDPEPDGVFDITDNCPDDANPSQGNFDGDTPGDVCDPDDDNDGNPDATDNDDDNDKVRDTDEANCGGATPSSLRPERVDGIFDNVDDDGDTLTDEALPGGSTTFDCDGDGYSGTAENHVYSYLPQTDGDQKTCQENDTSFPNAAAHIKPSKRWPSDIAAVGAFSGKKVNIQDISSFTTPIRYLNQNVGSDPGDVRFDIVPGSTFGAHINVQDMGALTSGSTGNPPMLGVRAFNGPNCPYAP
jgi:hypothetical protein